MRVRPYFFEIFTVANFVVLELVLRRIGLSPFTLLGMSLAMILPSLLLQVALGVAVRYAMGRRVYLDSVRNRAWVTDTVRIVVASALWIHVYGWIKIAVPLLNHRLYDQALWDLDRKLLFGLSPNVLFVNLFSHPLAMRAVDVTYANGFFLSLFIAGAFFLSVPDRRLRVGFTNANTAMWLIGAWLYVAVPALGPAYRFLDVWLPLEASLPQTQLLQRLLMTNYQTVIHLSERHAPVNLLFGVAAFPSLHAAFEMLVFLWMRGVSRAGKLVFAILTVVIFIGSVVTGWHYLVDALAGLLLATLCWAAFRLLPERFPRHASVD